MHSDTVRWLSLLPLLGACAPLALGAAKPAEEDDIMDSHAHNANPLYLLERSEIGLVELDRDLKVVAMNSFARQTLPVDDLQPFGKVVLSFHPERSQPKVKFLLDQASECPVSNPPPMTMIINIPERVLLIKVSKLSDPSGDTTGYTLIFHDITEVVAGEEPADHKRQTKRQLRKVPTVSHNRTVLVDAEAIIYVRAEGHYTWVHTAQGSSFSNLTISDLAERLDSETFLRVHRSYLANLAYAEQILREEGRISLQLRGGDHVLPVARASVPKLLEHLGLADTDAMG